jgi:hypothetical protein
MADAFVDIFGVAQGCVICIFIKRATAADTGEASRTIMVSKALVVERPMRAAVMMSLVGVVS